MTRPDPDEVLDALEGMVEQHFLDYGDRGLGHAFTSANEFAADVLVRAFPHRWRLTEIGLARVHE